MGGDCAHNEARKLKGIVGRLKAERQGTDPFWSSAAPASSCLPLPGMSQVSKITAADYFGAMVRSYDSLIRRAVPRYDEMTQRLLEYLPPTANHVIELGCGTGNLSLRLAQRYPSARLTLVDGAPEMIDLTRARLKAAHPQSAE